MFFQQLLGDWVTSKASPYVGPHANHQDSDAELHNSGRPVQCPKANELHDIPNGGNRGSCGCQKAVFLWSEAGRLEPPIVGAIVLDSKR